MAPRKKPAVVAEPASPQPAVQYLADPVTVAHSTPKTRDDIAIRDAVRARLAAIETAIVEFVTEKTVEGFTLAEIDQLYALELPLLFGYRVDGSRIRASYDAQIVERQA
ncbi:hypothetical protein N5K21_22425 [Rhizobium pusense]|jgi:hypothetical protein|uniref:Uncharacterized protein n=1 Tax=Agrobacterium pusense TaxID=648995 RepID=A0A6H0ZS70_9HYPH|nr:hypothetical protein [Agrobacterium pusense]MDH2091491.1 hypothetical protein [Agrobacterium pusense]QIX22630.1 hypothetical protein FOB41_16520 [Agrobacterium pusense]WCK24542.1 hypothetical protein CFBP5496_0002820 [Agrobacterium pusense]